VVGVDYVGSGRTPRWRYDVGQLLFSLRKREEAALASTKSEAPPDVQPPEAMPQSRLEVATDDLPEMQDASADVVEDELVATEAVEASRAEPETPEVAPKPAEDPIALDAARRKFHGLLVARITRVLALR